MEAIAFKTKTVLYNIFELSVNNSFFFWWYYNYGKFMTNFKQER